MTVPAEEDPTPDLETRVGWVTLAEVLELWSDAPGEPEEGFKPLPRFLAAAHGQLLRYASRAVFADPALIPEEVKLGQVLMAKHLWSRSTAGDQTGYGQEEWQMSTYPLVLEAKDKLRPWRNPFRGVR